MTTGWAYNALLYSLSDGSITFDATAASVRQLSPKDITGPKVQQRYEETQFGAVVDLDGTADSDLTPPLMVREFRFTASNPYAQTQFHNCLKLKGHYVTSTWRVPSVSTYTIYTAPARLVEVTASEQGKVKLNTPSYIIARLEIQLNDVLTLS